MAFLLFLRAIVLQENLAAAGYPCLHQHQRTMRVDGQRLRLFLDVLALHVFAANAHGHLHQYPLAAASRDWVHRCILSPTHPGLSSPHYTGMRGAVESLGG